MEIVLHNALPAKWAKFLLDHDVRSLESFEIAEIDAWIDNEKKDKAYRSMIAIGMKDSLAEGCTDYFFYVEDGTEEVSTSFIRDTSGVLEQKAIAEIALRFLDYCENNNIEPNMESWSLFWKPVDYLNFMSLMGQQFTYEGEVVTLERPYYYDGSDSKVDQMFGPSHASAQSVPRFGYFSPTTDVPYPVDADLKIRIKVVDSKRHRNIMLSYNQIAGLCEDGRDLNWTERYTYKSDSPSNSFLGNGSMTNNWLSDPLFRETPAGEPYVDELVKEGTVVQSNYCDTEYIVAGVHRYIYEPHNRPKDHIFVNFSFSLIDKKTRKGGYIINEVVARDGRLLKLFESNENEIFILGHVDEVPVAIMDEEDEDGNEEYCETCELDLTPEEDEVPEVEQEPKKEEPAVIKGYVQPSLF